MSCKLGTFGCQAWHLGGVADRCYRITICFACRTAIPRSIDTVTKYFDVFCFNCYWEKCDPCNGSCKEEEVEWVKAQLQRAGDDWLLNEAVRTILPFPVWEEMEPHLISGKPPNE